MVLTVHSQVTFRASALRKATTRCRQAAAKTAGGVWPLPQEYQLPFISWPKPRMTGRR
jgi:hypothetical protein